MKKILVLLSTYNGERYLSELLDSVLAQIGVNVAIDIRDDGSKDLTNEIILDYQKHYSNINLKIAENVGYAKSFWTLLQNASEEYDYYAFCDQDDIWLPNKLQAAVSKIEELNVVKPVLYTSNVIAINDSKQIISERLFNASEALSPYESLVKNILPGCTFVFNKSALIFLKRYNGFMESHDWATYNIINSLGIVLFDNMSYIHYRIHQNNTIGKENKIKNLCIKLKRLFKPSKCVRSRFAKDFYECYKDNLPSEFASAVYELGYYKTKKLKFKLIKNNNFKSKIFKIMVILGRV